jgi:predicted nucleic acid-binding protein
VKPVFADTFYFVGLLNRRDAHHQRVVEFATGYRGTLVTSRWVLAEVANAFSESLVRMDAARFLQRIERDPSFRVVQGSDQLYDRGLSLYANRPDKGWSLTDCISMDIMKGMRLSDILTRDHHFEQAGFRQLPA